MSPTIFLHFAAHIVQFFPCSFQLCIGAFDHRFGLIDQLYVRVQLIANLDTELALSSNGVRQLIQIPVLICAFV